MYQNNTNLTYKQKISEKQAVDLFKLCFFYLLEFVIWIFVSMLYKGFGVFWITPCVSAMWVMGTIACIFIPEQRQSTITTTKWVILGYLALLTVYRIAIQLLSSLTPEQLNAALNLSGTQSTGLALSGFLTNLLWIFALTGPIGFFIYIAKKFTAYHGKSTKDDAFARIKGMR